MQEKEEEQGQVQKEQGHQQEQGRSSPHRPQPLLPLKGLFFLSCSSWQSTLKDLFDLTNKTPKSAAPQVVLRVCIPKGGNCI